MWHNKIMYRRCDLCLHSNRPLLTKHCIRHVSPGKKTRSHGKIAYTFQLAAAETQRFCPAVCARIMLWFSSDVRGHNRLQLRLISEVVTTVAKFLCIIREAVHKVVTHYFDFYDKYISTKCTTCIRSRYIVTVVDIDTLVDKLNHFVTYKSLVCLLTS